MLKKSLYKKHFSISCFLLLVVWLFWPVSVDPPWLEEIPREIRSNELSSGLSMLCKRSFEEYLKIVDPDGVLKTKIELDDNYLLIEDEALDEGLKIEWGACPDERSSDITSPVDKKRSLDGLRILLDPGHYGGSWSKIEGRHFVVWIVPKKEGEQSVGGEPHEEVLKESLGRVISKEEYFQVLVTRPDEKPPSYPLAEKIGVIKEGDLNWATARLMQEMLVDAGAEVMLTRGPPPTRSFHESMDSRFNLEKEGRLWLDHARFSDPKVQRWARIWPARIAHLAIERYLTSYTEDNLFAFYNRWDLRRRSLLAEEFNADLTLSMHYNYVRFPKNNRVIVYMAGQKRKHELETAGARFFAYRRLVEGNFDTHVKIGGAIGRSMHDTMEMPPFPPVEDGSGTWVYQVPVNEESRLFARNLSIVRRTPGLVLLLEGPFMNNPQEALKLIAEDLQIDGEWYSRRTLDYAKAVVNALIESDSILQESASGSLSLGN